MLIRKAKDSGKELHSHLENGQRRLKITSMVSDTFIIPFFSISLASYSFCWGVDLFVWFSSKDWRRQQKLKRFGVTNWQPFWRNQTDKCFCPPMRGRRWRKKLQIARVVVRPLFYFYCITVLACGAPRKRRKPANVMNPSYTDCYLFVFIFLFYNYQTFVCNEKTIHLLNQTFFH